MISICPDFERCLCNIPVTSCQTSLTEVCSISPDALGSAFMASPILFVIKSALSV